MKFIKNLNLIFTLSILSFSLISFSQTLNEAGEAFNNAISLSETDKEKAIEAYNTCIEICNSIGEEGEELKEKAEKQLPGLYYKSAKELYKQKKMEEAIKAFEKTIEIAKKYNDVKTEKSAYNIIPQLYNSIGSSYYKEKDYDKALLNFNKALEMKPDYAKAYFGKGLVFKKKGELDKMKEAMDKAIELDEITESKKIANKAKTVSGKAFVNSGAKALQKGSTENAIKLLLISLDYNNKNANAYYYLTSAYNKQSRWVDAISSANKALELEQKNKANIYFELGKAQEGNGNKEAACSAYKKVNSGPNHEAAKHQITHVLKCN